MTATASTTPKATVDGDGYPAAAYAYVPDPDEPSTWKLRLWQSPSEKVTAAQVGRAVAAISPGGYRGSKAEIPAADMPAVKRKILAAWRKVHDAGDEVPAVLRKSAAADGLAALRKDAQPGVNQVHVDAPIGAVAPWGGQTAGLLTRLRALRGRLGTPTPTAKAMSAGSHGGNSAMVSLDLAPGTLTPLPGGTPDHHITVVYLGKDLDDDTFERICERARGVASATDGPLTGTVSGIDTFPPSASSDWLTPVFTVPSVPGLDRIRAAFEDLNASEHTDFHPHVTLGYAQSGSDLPAAPAAQTVTFDTLNVHRGDDVRRFPFAGTQPDRATASASTAKSVAHCAFCDEQATGDTDPPTCDTHNRMAKAAGLVVKDAAARFTFSPLYVPNNLDAHDDWADPDDLQKAVWDLVRSADRTINVQHLPGTVAGEWVELASWPWAHKADLTVPGQVAKSVTLPANTPWMGVIWTPAAWSEVRAGRLRGLSMEGRACRVAADLPGLAA